jgi:hypothetical protein
MIVKQITPIPVALLGPIEIFDLERVTQNSRIASILA